MRVNNDLLVDQSETNVAEWLGYIISVCDSETYRSFHRNISGVNKTFLLNFHYPDSLLPEKSILETLPWKNLLNNQNGYHLFFTACSNYPQSLPLNTDYFSSKEEKRKMKNLLELPITGISYEQALAFCNWRTRTDMRYDTVDSYLFRLPTLADYKLMNENMDSTVQFPKGKNLVGFNYKNLRLPEDTSAGKNIISIWEFKSSSLGIFGIQGNAAEMTNMEGIAYGGSYFHYAIESYDGKTQPYNSAQRWLGMRCVAVRKEN